MQAPRPKLLISGVAAGLGASLAKIFAGAGYDVIGLARSDRAESLVRAKVEAEGGTYTHLRCDIGRADAVADALGAHTDQIAVVVHSAHQLMIRPFAETSPEDIEDVWRTTCFGAMLVAGAVLPAMATRGSGCIVLTGATASLRGATNFAAFAAAKFALRGFAQSLAREYSPKGVHVAHVILDGLIDEPQTDRRFGAGATGRMDADSIARTYLALVQQEPSAWTHELDVRPFSERF